MEEKRNYQRNYYINKRNYIRGLDRQNRDELTPDELLDLDKYIHKFRPKSGRALRMMASNPLKGEPCRNLKKETKQVVVYFD